MLRKWTKAVLANGPFALKKRSLPSTKYAYAVKVTYINTPSDNDDDADDANDENKMEMEVIIKAEHKIIKIRYKLNSTHWLIV